MSDVEMGREAAGKYHDLGLLFHHQTKGTLENPRNRTFPVATLWATLCNSDVTKEAEMRGHPLGQGDSCCFPTSEH